MANMAPMKAYQGSRGMKRVKEGSKADERADRGMREGSKRDQAHDAAKNTILGKARTPRVKRG